MNLLKNELVKKANQLKKKSKSSTDDISTNRASTATLATNNSLNSPNGSDPTVANNSSSSTGYLKPEEKIKRHLIQSIEDWCKKGKENRDQQMVQLNESIDYEIVTDLHSNKTLIKCQCGAISTLGQKDNNFIVSHFSSKIAVYDTKNVRIFSSLGGRILSFVKLTLIHV
jgi:hypothetical protein